MTLKKFPIVSDKGKVYEVVIMDFVSTFSSFVVIELKVKNKFLWFERYTLVYSDEILLDEFDNDWDNDYIAFTQYHVNVHEEHEQIKIDRENKLNRNKLKFKEWDGRC